MDARDFLKQWKPTPKELEDFQSAAREVAPREDWNNTWMIAFAEAYQKSKATEVSRDAILKLQPRSGDYLFVNPGAVDTLSLTRMHWPEETKGLIVICVHPLRGLSVKDAVQLMPKEQALQILESIAAQQ